jgi:hypothetical protein
MATLAFGGPLFDGASKGVVVRDHADRSRTDRVPTCHARLSAAPIPGVARVAVGRLLDWLAVVLGREGLGPSRAGPADRKGPSDGTAATRAAIRHQLVAFRAPPPVAMTVAGRSRARSWGGSGRHVVIALPIDYGRLSPW